MNNWQRAGAMAALAAGVVLVVLMYWSQHLTYKSAGVEDAAQRIGILEKARGFWPVNDRTLYELGKAYFDFGYRNLADAAAGENNMERSIRSYARALRMNPANFYAHYNLGQSLFYMDHMSPSESGNYLAEYKKAADLTGHRNEIYFEVGKVYFSHWNTLSEEERTFTIQILRKIFDRRNSAQFQSILQTWDMNVGDYAVMGRILPDDPFILRQYAQFLGEKSLDLEERQRVLAKAEHLDFERAKEIFNQGENQFRYYRVRQAAPFYLECLDILAKIKLYQRLTGGIQIDTAQLVELKRMALLKLAKCSIQQKKPLGEVVDYLRKYLVMEGRVADASELETYLKEYALIGKTLDDSANDLWLLNFHTFLYFKQNKYRDIKNIGSLLGRSFVVVPEKDKKDYIEVLDRVAESHLITGNLYDALEYYRKALEVDGDDLGTMLGMRRNYERLSEDREVEQINRQIEGLLSPRDMDFGGRVIAKGDPFVQTLVLDGGRVSLRLEFSSSGGEGQVFPLICVMVNGRVMFEDYVSDGAVSVMVDSDEGENRLEVVPLNRPVTLMRISWQ
jgi:tetratricopeptide (TPR) repeat protein